MDKQYIIEAAKAVNAKMPDNHGFILMVMPFNTKEARLVYMSSMEREDAITVIKEWLISCSGEEEWLKHIK